MSGSTSTGCTSRATPSVRTTTTTRCFSTREEYDELKYTLQVELLKFQTWAVDTGTKHVLLFEGRDAAGKGGTIKRFMEHLNPRYARTVAMGKPSDREQQQWYFQRYVPHLPTAGEMVLFDRSW
jgi:polyphosphate kinase 2 (PPK2 family)